MASFGRAQCYQSHCVVQCTAVQLSFLKIFSAGYLLHLCMFAHTLQSAKVVWGRPEALRVVLKLNTARWRDTDSSMSNAGILLKAVLKINTPCLTPFMGGCKTVVRCPLLDILNFNLVWKYLFFYSIWLSFGQSFDFGVNSNLTWLPRGKIVKLSF